jgi:hypothetical protein
VNPIGAMYPTQANTKGNAPWEVQHAPAYPVAIDSKGNADCEFGQHGFPTGPNNGPITRGNYDPTYKPRAISSPTNFNEAQTFDEKYAGGSHTVNADNLPGLRGPTFTGIKNLKDLP